MPLWLDRSWINRLPAKGAAWDRIVAESKKSLSAPRLGERGNLMNVRALAKAIVTIKGTANHTDEIKRTLDGLPASPLADALSLGRQLAGWLTVADLISYRPTRLVGWASSVRYARGDDPHPRWPTLDVTCRDTCNNWGMFCFASFLAASVYVQDEASIARCEQIMRGVCGDPLAWRFRPTAAFLANGAGSSWCCPGAYAAGRWTAINPPCDAQRDGAWVEDVVRGSPDGVRFPRVESSGHGYIAESLHGALHAALILSAQGRDVWQWSDKGLLRAYRFWSGLPPLTDFAGNRNLGWIVNGVYKTTFPVKQPGLGRQLAFSDWLFPLN